LGIALNPRRTNQVTRAAALPTQTLEKP
jgi:hypothetical protein